MIDKLIKDAYDEVEWCFLYNPLLENQGCLVVRYFCSDMNEEVIAYNEVDGAGIQPVADISENSILVPVGFKNA